MSISKKFKSRRKIPIHELETGKCKNCGTEFKGHYCPDCGQEVAEFNRPFGFIMYDFMGNFFAFDTRFFITFKYLLFYPGFLTQEFFRGKRKKYSPPFRIFVFLSFVLFLILSFLTDKGLEAELNTSINESPQTVKENIAVLNNELNRAENELNEIPLDSLAPNLFKIQNDSAKIKIDLVGIFFGKGSIRERLDKLANVLEAQITDETEPDNRNRIKKYVTICRAPEVAISKLLQYLSWASFILLPLFALILKLFYVRRKQLYIKHLLFSIHIHSFVFIILILITLPWLLFNSIPGIIVTILLFTIPLYIIIALHKFYAQSWGKTIVKLILMGMIYNFIITTVVLAVFLKSIQVI
jgi:hypothetical protein